MSEEDTDTHWLLLILFLILIAGQIVAARTSQSDKEVLLELKTFLQDNNPFNRGRYTEWNNNSSPCYWPGISCSANERVTGINLSDYNISGKMFGNFSLITELSELDLSMNTIDGPIPDDFNRCKNLKYLNLSHNILEGELNLTGLINLATLDLTVNRFYGEIRLNFPALCNNLVTLNISSNNFTGTIDDCFDECWKLQYLDLSANNFSGQIWSGFQRLQEFSVAENKLVGEISPSFFTNNCSLELLDLSENHFHGSIPKEVSNCKSLYFLNLADNNLTGPTPSEIGTLPNLVTLLLGKNRLSREIPESLLNLTQLAFLDYSWNSFGGEIQEIFGKFQQLQYLVLHGNYYTGGLTTSGILKLPNLLRLDLSINNFTGPLPVELSEMPRLKYLFLAYNQFNGGIPPEFGNFSAIQALDVSSNRLTGNIPPTIGKLNSLLWLMLANNFLTGEIPHEIGNCNSLLWLNLANNSLSGTIPAEISNIAHNPTPTFESNRNGIRIPAGSGECMTMKRWIPANYPPFNFVYSLLTRKSCRSLWDLLLKGYAIFPICAPGSMVRTLQITGYLQLTGNQFSGNLPPEIGNLHNFTLVHVGFNNFSGELPPEIAIMPLMVLDVSYNGFSGKIPSELGNAKCLQNLDLSHNNFSGDFPASLNNLNELSKFNVSYNPLITGVVPSTGQLTTFEEDSFLGDPLLHLPNFMNHSHCNGSSLSPSKRKPKQFWKKPRMAAFLVFLALTSSFLIGGVLSLIFCIVFKTPADQSLRSLSEDSKECHNRVISSGRLSLSEITDYMKVIHLDKTAFTYADVKLATGNFSVDRIIGTGGFGTVYRGVLPDGRDVAVKKLQREGFEGEKEFKSEMEVLSCSDIGWPHPNLVTLYGWCLHGKEKLLVYEYMEGGTLEDLLPDRLRLTWQMRLDVATDVARALVYLHHECFPAIVHRDVKASNVLLDKGGGARVTDFGLARVVDAGESHVSTMVAGTVGYVAPEYGQTWHATTKGDVYSFGVLAMELATGRRALDGGEECLVEWARRVIGDGRHRHGLGWAVVPVVVLGPGFAEGAEKMCELLRVGLRCTAEVPQARPNMKEVFGMLVKIAKKEDNYGNESATPSQIVPVETLKLSIDSR
ncbi:probable LRR receptor-like serine/threonine-protein kinase At1g74360 [Macadamia integrifolia]|uniref:probable LRR receptor-like serine/threonine-protein kinase At1g74360 n=1 Tax=Macadamia integrifolia TaxID=60698 RepID=UPI001C4ECDD5|nr:probable LRR receptor-like serine/threonine-protein kinase At1g74360 [Macadamia integrifolia]